MILTGGSLSRALETAGAQGLLMASGKGRPLNSSTYKQTMTNKTL